MGLDMFLYRVKKAEGFSAMDYAYANVVLGYCREKERAKENKVRFKDTLEDWGVPSSMTLEKAKVLESEYKQVGDYIKYFSIFDKVGYWRKANHVHAWFVDKVQGGNDDCLYYFVTKENFFELKEACEKVVALNPYSIDKNSDLFNSSVSSLIDSGVITKSDYEEMKAKLEEIMPTQSGYFFGAIDYSPYYFLDVEETLEIVDKILENGDFDKEIYLYNSSW